MGAVQSNISSWQTSVGEGRTTAPRRVVASPLPHVGESTYQSTSSTLLPDSLELALGSPAMGLPTTAKDPPSSQLGAWEGHW